MPRHVQKNHVSKKSGVVNEPASALEEKIEPSCVMIPLSKNSSQQSSPPHDSHNASPQQSASALQSIVSSQPVLPDVVSLKDTLQKICYLKVHAEKFFILCTGEPIQQYLQLAHLLDTMADEVFYYHVTESRNDFANWIRDVFNEPQLAMLAAQASSPAALRAILYAHIIKKIELSIV